MKFGVRKLRVLGLPDGEEIMPASFLHFDTIPARDRQTDRRTDGSLIDVAIAITRASIASRG